MTFGEGGEAGFAVAVAAGAVRSGTPVLYAALGEVLAEKSGVLNVGLEGVMLGGALTAVVVSLHTGSPAAAVVAAFGAGLLLGTLHAIACLGFRANQVAAGIALTLFASGLTAYLGIPYVGKKIAALPDTPLEPLAGIPVLGPVFFQHDWLVYCSYLAVPLVAFLLYRTRFGLSVRAAGEDPHAAAAAGVQVIRVRAIAVALGAGLGGIAGAYMSLAYSQGWIENLTTGRGLIAVGLVIFARWNPWLAAAGAYLFGGTVSLQLRLQAAGSSVSPYLLDMAPYLVVIIVLTIGSLRGSGNRGGMPAALGKPYRSQD